MNLKPEQLERALEQALKPVYLVSGDEPLLVQECVGTIRAAARDKGFTERELFSTDTQFKWDELAAAGNALSLFAERKVIELRIPNGKPGDAGSKALQAYCEQPPPDNLLLVVMPKLDKRTQNGKWFKAIDKVGINVTIWPVSADNMPRWIAQRARGVGLTLDQEAAKLLADLLDGNLLAASQELEKLKLIAPENTVNADLVRESVADSARYSVFNLADAALKGDARYAIKMLTGLRAEGTDLLGLLWALAKEVRQLTAISRALAEGQPAPQAMQQQGVWRNRQPLVQSALKRLTPDTLEHLLRKVALVDRIAKGAGAGNGWDELEQIIATLAGKALVIDR